jgi:transcriptional regulator of acetoin/glycerol metabolism
MATAGSTDVRRRLRALGVRRARQEEAEARLIEDIRNALADADGQISVSEQANLLKLHRTTLYRVYK